MLLQRSMQAAGAGFLACVLASGAWAAEPPQAAPTQPGAEQIRAMKIEFLKDCCYNRGGVTEHGIESIPTAWIVQYPALRQAAEAQVPHLNRMFAGRYLGSVVSLDPMFLTTTPADRLKPKILYFVKGLTAADVARVKADPRLPDVQLADSAYALGEVAALEQRQRKEGLRPHRLISPQEKAIAFEAFGVRHASLKSIDAFPQAVLIQNGMDLDHSSIALASVLGEQVVAVERNGEILGHPRLLAYVYQPTPEQLDQLRHHPTLHDAIIVPYQRSPSDIERIQQQLVEILGPDQATSRHALLTRIGFDYKQARFDVGILPGKLAEARQLLSAHPDIPADCCLLRELPPVTPAVPLPTIS